jgi:hypothetical protein
MSNPDLDDLIRAHRSEVHLSGEQRARGRARLLAQVGTGAAVLSATSLAAGAGSGAKLGFGLLGKLGIGLALVGLAGGGYYVLKPAAPLQNQIVESHLKTKPAQAVADANQATDPPSAAALPVVGGAVPPAERDAKTAAPHPSSSQRSSLADEVKTMRQVDAAMRAGDARGALALLGPAGSDEGSMKEERAAARIFALCRLGQTRQASQEAVQFARHFPRSPLLGRVQSGCSQAQ